MIFRLVVDTRVFLAVTAPPALLSFGWMYYWRWTSLPESDVDLSASSGGDLHEFGDRPHKPRQLAGDRGRDDGRRLSRPGEFTISPTQSFLRLPCGVADRLGQALLPQQLLPADARREPITPGSLDQHSARRAVSSFRDATLAARGSAGVLGRNQAKIGHELAGIVEAGDVAKFCNQCRRRDQSHSA